MFVVSTNKGTGNVLLDVEMTYDKRFTDGIVLLHGAVAYDGNCE